MAVLLVLKCFNISTFFNVVCISWKLKCWTVKENSKEQKKDINERKDGTTREMTGTKKVKENSWIKIEKR